MILVIDVGNSNIVYGIYDDRKLLHIWRMATNSQCSSDEFGMFIINLFNHVDLKVHNIEAVIIASVVPQIMYSLEHSIRKYFNLKPIVVGPGTKTGIDIKYENPKQLGVDRLVNAVAAYELYGGPIIIVDFGTATKFCAISEKGEHLGGMICAGIKVSAEALFQSTANLPRIELFKPQKVICRNTVNGMQSGIINGYEGMVTHLITTMKKEMGNSNIKVVATGGLASLICENIGLVDEVNSYLILEGLRIIYEKNKKC